MEKAKFLQFLSDVFAAVFIRHSAEEFIKGYTVKDLKVTTSAYAGEYLELEKDGKKFTLPVFSDWRRNQFFWYKGERYSCREQKMPA